VVQQLGRGYNRLQSWLRNRRLARLHLGDDDNRQRIEGHRRRFLDVDERAAVMHLAQLRRDVLEPREDIVGPGAGRVVVDGAGLLVGRQPVLQDTVTVFCGIIDILRCWLLVHRRGNRNALVRKARGVPLRSRRRSRLHSWSRSWLRSLGGRRKRWVRSWSGRRKRGCLHNRNTARAV
jgi:hypothetical protein